MRWGGGFEFLRRPALSHTHTLSLALTLSRSITSSLFLSPFLCGICRALLVNSYIYEMWGCRCECECDCVWGARGGRGGRRNVYVNACECESTLGGEGIYE